MQLPFWKRWKVKLVVGEAYAVAVAELVVVEAAVVEEDSSVELELAELVVVESADSAELVAERALLD